MAEHPTEEVPHNVHEEEDEDEVTPGYKPPEQKSLSTIVQLDQEDESLRKYKETLLGPNPTETIFFPEDPRHVIMHKLELLVEGREEVKLDLSGDDHNLKKLPKVMKEGVQYRIRFHFHIQREIVTGLKYIQKTSRKGLRVDKTTHMVGSYGPKSEVQTYTTPVEDAPSVMLARGSYTIQSEFTDDDKSEHLKNLKWEWTLEIKKDWE